MLFYIQMKWKIEGRVTLDEMWDLQLDEVAQVKDSLKVIAMYKVAVQRRVICIAEFPSATELDRALLGRLPLAEYLEFEAVWPIRPYDEFIEDCRTHFVEPGPGATLGSGVPSTGDR
jgi:muconolactone delta-isomerase